MLRRLALPLGTVSIALTIAGTAWFAQTGTSSRRPQTYPPFQMTYVRAAAFDEASGNRFEQTWFLDYRSDSSWRQTLISDTQYPARAGTTESFDGKSRVYHNALANTDDTITYDDGTIAAPAEWLVPRTQGDYLSRGFQIGARGTLVRTQVVDCVSEAAGSGCQSTSGTTSMTTMITLSDDGLPLNVTTKFGDLEVVEFRVLDLKRN
jgi:hypothetical protein